MEVKFTPGPWEVEVVYHEEPGYEQFVKRVAIVDKKEDGAIYSIARMDWSNPSLADAYLITAAPELYEACRLARSYYEMLERSTGIGYGVLKELRAALAKAEGR